jgi:hypothetical protein
LGNPFQCGTLVQFQPPCRISALNGTNLT